MDIDRAYAFVLERVFLRAWEERVRRRPTMSLLDSLRRTQWLDPEEMRALSLEKLRRLLIHAGAHVPYYREVFRKTGFDPRAMTRREELAALPLLTKAIVRERYDDLLDPATRGKNLKKGTSGSTGEPLKFEYSMESEAWRNAIKIRGYEWGGYRLGAPTFHYWASVYGPSKGLKGMKLGLDRRLKRETFFDSMKQDEASMKDALQLMRRARPRVIICYTQAMAHFARWITDNKLRDWDDVHVLCGAEAVLPGDRAAIAAAFGPHIFDTYGSRETMLLASECSAHDGLHLSEENLFVEVVKGTTPLGPGESGDVAVTDLNNFSMPFIRYVNGDVARLGSEKRCACGRGLRKLERVEGRRAEFLYDKDGTPIPGIIFHVLFSDSRQEVVKQFQAVQKASREVTFKCVRGAEYSDDAFAIKVSRFREYLRGLPVTIEFVDSIPAMPNGKRKTIIVENLARAPATTPAL